MLKKVMIMMTMIMTLMVGSVCYARDGEDPDECFNRIAYSGTWVVQNPPNNRGKTIDLNELFSEVSITKYDVLTEYFMFDFVTFDGAEGYAEILKGSGLLLYDGETNKLSATLIRFAM